MLVDHKPLGRLVVVTLFLAFSSAIAHAQDVPNYLFLEVLDSSKKPIKDAIVEMTPPKVRKIRSTFNAQTKKTDQSGTVGIMLPHVQFEFSQSIFKISKPGYFDFFDFGLQIRTRDYIRLSLELLKIPETRAEEKALGNEQIKRELLWAAKNGDADAVKRLLKKSLDPNLKTGDLRGISMPQNIAAVLLAAGSGDGDTVRTFLDAGANVRVKEEPLHSILAYYLTVNPATLREYLNEKERAKAIEEFRKGLARLIKGGAATRELYYAKGMTAMMISARENDPESVAFLIQLGVPVNHDIDGYTALIAALDQYGHNYPGYTPRKVVEVLLKAGANPNIVASAEGDNCRSPLMLAAYGGDVETARLLLANKADVNFTCKNGANAIKWAHRYTYVGNENQKRLIALLEDAGAKKP
jgi:ankyrin repeat protein